MIAWINSWLSAVNEAGFIGGVYFGVPQPVTASDAYNDLPDTTLFWKSEATSRDESLLIVDPARPVSSQCVFERFRLSDALVAVSLDILDKRLIR